MDTILVIAIIVAAIAVVVALVRGLIGFLRTAREDVDGPGTSDMHAFQNRMMFARVKYQAIAIILLVLLGIVAAAN